MSNVNYVTFTIVLVLFLLVTLVGFAAARWRRADDMMHLNEWGLGGRSFGTFVGLVPARRRPVHRVHVHRGARGGVRRRRGDGLLRGVVHDHGVPDRADLPAPAVVDRPDAQLRHARRLRPRPVRVPRPVAGHGVHRHPGPDALHRAAAGGHPGRAHRDGGRHLVDQHLRQGPAPVHRVPGPRHLHLRLRPAGPGADRVRQGHPGLRHGHRGGVLHPDQDRRLGAHLRRTRRPT